MREMVAKAQAFIPLSTDLLRDFGPLPGDEETYARYAKPYRRGILSPRRLRDKRLSRERILRSERALRHALRRATEDLNDLEQWVKTRQG
jgi:hypothetical protein